MNKIKFSLKGLRTNMGLTQKQMADLIEVSPKTWENYEAYRTFSDVPVIERIIDKTGVSYDDIIFLPINYGLTVNSERQECSDAIRSCWA